MQATWLSAAALLSLTLASAGCSGASLDEEISVTGHDELSVERVPLPTAHTLLGAGDPYSPVLDERPLAIGGQTSCLTAPSVAITPGSTEVEASIVSTRRDLMRRLDLGVDGVPINVRALTGATGTARLLVETKLNQGSLTLMLQAKGTFESALVGAGEAIPRFDPTRIEECGWGYVRKAYHRLSAVVMVSIESSDHSSLVRLGCGADESNCTPTSVGAGPVQVKVALERMLQHGSFNISLRSVADVIPDLDPAPFGSMVSLSSTPETAGETIDKLQRALDWLGEAQSAISEQIAAQTAHRSATAAPTMKIDFAYYPGLDASLKDRLGTAYDHVVSLRTEYEKNLDRVDTWEAFDAAREVGQGHYFNVAGAPAASIEELSARKSELLSAEGLVTQRRSALESALGRCEDANRTADSSIDTLVNRVEASCVSVTPEPWDAAYETRYGIRRLAVRSIMLRGYDEWQDNNCPSGQRLPRRSEAELLAPFSAVTAQDQGRGVWIQRAGWFDAPIFLRSGRIESVGLFAAPQHFAVCFGSDGSLFE